MQSFRRRCRGRCDADIVQSNSFRRGDKERPKLESIAAVFSQIEQAASRVAHSFDLTPRPKDLSYLADYAYSEVPPDTNPAEIVLQSLADIPVGTPIDEIKLASDAFGLDFTFMKAVARIESDFDPKQRTGSYIGLFQPAITSLPGLVPATSPARATMP